ncbi:hypothetical protein CCMA1212_000675 [Trichoderma ghanense]|uniref:Uncharacterized protein n=1 Tax=Trichoderma ghanense TaxID=65468 RepID=A0ABY2HFX1_9HYPO
MCDVRCAAFFGGEKKKQREGRRCCVVLERQRDERRAGWTGPRRFASIARRVLLLLPRAAASSNAAARMVEGRGREPPWSACDAVDEAVRMEEREKTVAVPLRLEAIDAEMQAEGGRKRRKRAEAASQPGSQSSHHCLVGEMPWQQTNDTVTPSSPPCHHLVTLRLPGATALEAPACLVEGTSTARCCMLPRYFKGACQPWWAKEIKARRRGAVIGRTRR